MLGRSPLLLDVTQRGEDRHGVSRNRATLGSTSPEAHDADDRIPMTPLMGTPTTTPTPTYEDTATTTASRGIHANMSKDKKDKGSRMA